MNERIRELESQCWEAKQYGPPWFNSTKFAELIVRECMNIVGDGTVDGEIYHDRIKHHFGVEE
jgi:hypothetical protein